MSRAGHPQKPGPDAGWKPFEAQDRPALQKKEKQTPRSPGATS